MHANVGQILSLKGDLTGALLHNYCALQTLNTLPVSERRNLHTVFNNMGDICIREAEVDACRPGHKSEDIFYVFSQGLQFYRTALSLALNDPDKNLKSIAVYYNNIGGVLKLLKRFDEALEYFNKCLLIELDILPSAHFSLATTYNNIGSVAFYLKDYTTALSNYQKCLAIQRRSLPAKHPLISDTYSNIAMVYNAQSDYERARDFMKEAVDIGSYCLSPQDKRLQLYQMTYLEITKKL